jgi:hypothetical protein
MGFLLGCMVTAWSTAALWWLADPGSPERAVRAVAQSGKRGGPARNPEPLRDSGDTRRVALVREDSVPAEPREPPGDPAPRETSGIPRPVSPDRPEKTARERIRLELVDGEDSAEVLEGLDALEELYEAPPVELLDPERLERLFTPRSAGAMVYGPDLGRRPDDQVEDGVVLSFPPGIHRLRNLMRHKHPFPRDVTLRGAGMNATLLVLDELSAHSSVVNFAVQDCTVFADLLFDLRGDNRLAIQMHRVRVVGFDKGAGSSCAFDTSATLLYATDSRFEGGYGRLPGSGRLFDVGTSALAARFDRCHFSRIEIDNDHVGTVLCRNCELLEMLRDPREDDVILENCTVTFLERVPGESWRTTLARDLRELFPDWDPQKYR